MATVARKSRHAQTDRGNRAALPTHPAEPLTPRWFPPAIIVVVTFLAFLPVLQNGFVNWDDLANLVNNLNYRGLGWRHLRWMFTTFHESLYRPITWLTFGLDYLLWGMDPAGYHLTSLLFHCANAAVFYFVALRILRSAIPAEKFSELGLRMGAAFAALVFSLHPLRVEAVAWASARNDVVSAWFFLLALIAYLRAAGAVSQSAPEYRRWLTAALILYTVSLGAKAAGMTLPAALLVLDIYPLRRLRGAPWRWLEPPARGIIFEKVPFFLLALAAAAIAVLAKQEFQALHSLRAGSLPLRIGESFYGLAFYLWKTILPFGLSPLYQRRGEAGMLAWPFILSGMAVAILTLVVAVWRNRRPAGAACWGWYGVLLIPFLGLVQFGPQIVADRYSYLSCLGLALLAGAAATSLWQAKETGRMRRRNFLGAAALGIAALIGLSALSWRQSRVWQDSEKLWRYVLAINPATSYAYHNLAAEMNRRGNSDAAITYYRKAVELDPQFALAHHNLGDILAARREFDEAARSYRRALAVDPKSIVTYHNLGNLFAQQGRYDEATPQYLKALEINPRYARAHNDLGNLLVALGQFDQAAERFRTAAALDATLTEPYFNLGNLMVRLDQLDNAIAYFQRALAIDPNDVRARNNLGRVLAARGKLDEAVGHFREAVRLEPGFAEAHESLISALIEQGNTEEASRQFQLMRRLVKGQGAATKDGARLPERGQAR